MVDQIGKLINAVEKMQESGKVLQEASTRTLDLLEQRQRDPSQPLADPATILAREPKPTPENPISILRGDQNYDLRLVHRIYTDSLRSTKVSKIPDYRFETAYMTWTRLTNDVPVNESHKRALMSHSFEGIALRTFEEIAAANPMASSEDLWKMLRSRICNESQVMSLRSEFMNIRFNDRKESVQSFANKLRSSALNLPEE
eukprot:IDg15039t1